MSWNLFACLTLASVFLLFVLFLGLIFCDFPMPACIRNCDSIKRFLSWEDEDSRMREFDREHLRQFIQAQQKTKREKKHTKLNED